jgi:hypothetical protein
MPPRPARLHAYLFAFVALALLTIAPRRALAQGTVTVAINNSASLPRVNKDGSPRSKRATIAPEGINLQDCRDDMQVQFPLTVTGFATSDNFEVWGTDQSGADCTVATARSGATQTCYQVPANFSRVQTQTTNIGVKEIIKGLPAASSDVAADGCRRVNAYTISLFFLVLRGTDVAGNAKVTLSVDTQGPTALSGVRLQPGNTAVTIAWDAVGEGGADDITGARVFCDPDPKPVGASDAGTKIVCLDDSGATTTAFDASDTVGLAEAGVTCSEVANSGGAAGAAIPVVEPGFPSDGKSCASQAFAPVGGVELVADDALYAKYGCGKTDSSTGNTIRVSDIAGVPLENGRVYAVAVAAIDSFGNLGEISPQICQYPEETSDFWRDYRGAGGQSGGGFCSIEGPGFPAGSFGVMALVSFVGLASLRRLQRRRSGR